MENIEFTAHNIRLDNGSFTKPDEGSSMENYPVFISAKRILDVVFPENKNTYRLADLGCLEGGYAVEFARMGFQVVGIEIRDANIAACNFVKANTNLPNLEFKKDDVLNIAKYGVFDAVFCCGLFYHLDKPKQFLNTLSAITKKVLILNTHFSPDTKDNRLPKIVSKVLAKIKKKPINSVQHNDLSRLTENEMLMGRWYPEFSNDDDFKIRENFRWASWDNRRSFWIQREYLLQAMYDAGFDVVMEQYDSLAPNIADSIISGNYKINSRGTFIGIKTQKK